MDLRKIEYFLSVAKEQSFTKAAGQLNVSQSGISQQIASLEEELEVKLINRSKNKFELTDAGKALLGSGKDLINQYDRMVKNVKEIHYRSQLDINFGYAGPIEATIIEPIVSLIQQHYPDMNFNFEKNSFKEIGEALLNRTLDIAIAYSYDLVSHKKVISIPLRRDALGLIVSKNHPLAARQKMAAFEVAHENIIMLNREYGEKNYKNMLECCALDGYQPNIIEEVDTLEAMFLKVNANKGVAFFSKGYAEKFFRNVHFIELEGTHHIDRIDLAWLKDNDNDYIIKIIRLIQNNIHKLF
ncbi:LysR family transcriptional regulator [Eubacteriaceae bacterium ES2]|nr:LysR family transcriptional regulator [Eubacteriaceae bacterium ES2]